MESRLRQGPARLHYSNAVLRLLRHGGFTVPMAYRAFILIDSYLYGFIMQDVNWPFDASNISDVAEEAAEQTSPTDYLYLMEAMGHVMTMSVDGKFSAVYDTEFAAGLELVLDSLARLRDTQALRQP